MKCPKCGLSMMTIVYGTKEVGAIVRRTRRCTSCDYRFITTERVTCPVKKKGKKED